MKRLIAIILILSLCLCIPIDVYGEDDSLKVIITFEDKLVTPGTTHNFVAHVFDKGVYVDPDNITAMLGFYDGEEITMTKLETGKFQGTLTVPEGDSYTWLTVEVERGTDTVSEMSYISPEDDDLEVDVKLDDQMNEYANPGDSVGVTVTVEDTGTPVVPDTIEISVNGEPIEPTNPSTGVYKFTYTVPADLTVGTAFEIYVDAQKGEQYGFGYGSFNVIFYSVWYHSTAKSETSSTFDIYVTDANNTPISGAAVNIFYDNDDDWETEVVLVTKTTDASGKATFTLTYSSIPVLEVYGNVSFGGLVQEFEPMWPLYMGSEISEDVGFDIIRHNPTGSDYLYYTLGQVVTLDYKVMFDGTHLPNQEVYYYLVSGGLWGMGQEKNVFDYGKITSDNNGIFSLTITLPDDSVAIYFESGVPKTPEDSSFDEDDDLVYHEDMDTLYVMMSDENPTFAWDGSVSIEVEQLQIGSETQVTVSGMDIPSDAIGVAFFICGAEDGTYMDIIMDMIMGDWQSWTEVVGSFYLTKSGDTFTGSIFLPDFMPENENYAIIAGWGNPEDEDDSHINRVILKPGESAVSEAPTASITLDAGDGTVATVNVGAGVSFDHRDGTHKVILKSITSTGATIEVSSDTQTFTLDVGKTKEVDSDGNGMKDLAITLESVDTTAQTADIKIKAIEESFLNQNTMLILVVLIVVIIIVVIAAKKKGGKAPTESPQIPPQPQEAAPDIPPPSP